MTQHKTTCFVEGHFTYPYNATIKIVLQLQDTYARVFSIWKFTAYNSVHTEKLKHKTDPRYITIPKHAWQDTLHVHMHNSMYKLIVHYTQRTQYMQYITGNSNLPDCGGYVFSVALLLRWCSMPPPSMASTCFFYPCFCNAEVLSSWLSASLLGPQWVGFWGWLHVRERLSSTDIYFMKIN
jgi:hypothetical protein